jgi:superfamily I DNA/RNA helicase
MHGAKGLEWDTVFVIALVEFWMPLNYAIEQSGTDEEERRLFYVASTRAKDNLHLTHFYNSTNQYGRKFSNKVSRFIREIEHVPYQNGSRQTDYRTRASAIIGCAIERNSHSGLESHSQSDRNFFENF